MRVSSTCEESFLLCYLIACVSSSLTSFLPPLSRRRSKGLETCPVQWRCQAITLEGADGPADSLYGLPHPPPPPLPPLVFAHPIWRKINRWLSQSAAAVKLLCRVGQEERVQLSRKRYGFGNKILGALAALLKNVEADGDWVNRHMHRSHRKPGKR